MSETTTAQGKKQGDSANVKKKKKVDIRTLNDVCQIAKRRGGGGGREIGKSKDLNVRIRVV